MILTVVINFYLLLIMCRGLNRAPKDICVPAPRTCEYHLT